jgi:hypothetical protein
MAIDGLDGATQALASSRLPRIANFIRIALLSKGGNATDSTKLVRSSNHYPPALIAVRKTDTARGMPCNDAERASRSSFIFVGLEAAALKPWINPGGNIRPQPDLYGEQRVDFEAGQLPTLLS